MPKFVVDTVATGSQLTKEELTNALTNFHRAVVHDELGRPRHLGGGEADIWRAGLDGEYAIKAFRENTENRAANEFKSLQMLQSSIYTPRVYALGRLVEDDGVEHLAIVEEYVHGISLAELVESGVLTGGMQGKRLDAVQAARISLELVRGIQELNNVGLSHRDISCNNVLVNDQDIDGSFSNGVNLRLVDFGTSTEVARPKASVLGTGARLATIPYGAPEIFGGKHYNERRLSDKVVMQGKNAYTTDVWSIGALIVFLMWGEYWPEELEDIRQKQRTGQLFVGQLETVRIARAKESPIDLVSLIQQYRLVTKRDREMAEVVQGCTRYKPSMRPTLDAIETTLLEMIERWSEEDGYKKQIPSNTPAFVQSSVQDESPKNEEKVKSEREENDSIQEDYPSLQQRDHAETTVGINDDLADGNSSKGEATASSQKDLTAAVTSKVSSGEAADGPNVPKIVKSLISESVANFKPTPWETLIIKRGVLLGCDPCPRELVVPDGVTSIGKEAFKDKVSVTLVVLPESVTRISDSAFFGCRFLKRVVMPSVKKW